MMRINPSNPMKTVYHLETYAELAAAASPVRQDGDPLPTLTGRLWIRGQPGSFLFVEL